MKKFLCYTGIFMALGTLGWSVDKEEQTRGVEEDSTYVFLGANLMAEYRSNFCPVLSADGKRLIIDSLKGPKRVKFDTRCSIQLQVEYSKNFVEIDNLDRKSVV